MTLVQRASSMCRSPTTTGSRSPGRRPSMSESRWKLPFRAHRPGAGQGEDFRLYPAAPARP